jgi:peptidyl-prolyl cis-trans isomerase C
MKILYRRRQRIRSILAWMVMAAFVFVACSKQEQPKTDVVAQVNLAQMTTRDLDLAVPQAVSAEIGTTLKRKLVEKWIEDEIFYQAALREGMALSDNEMQQVENYRRSLLVGKYLDKYVNMNYKPLDQEIENYYNQHRKEFVWEDEYTHLIHLVLDTDDQTLKDEISKSVNLIEVIKNNYMDQQASTWRPIGDLGYIKLKDFPPRLVQIIRQTPTGAIRGPIKTEYGYHYIQVIDLQPAGAQQELEVVREEIIMRLKIERRMKEIDKLKQNLQPSFTIQTDLSKLNQQE